MAGSKISALKTAASDLATKLYGLAATSAQVDPVKMALVPFSGAVNVGPAHAADNWMDKTGIATTMGDNFEASSASTPVNVFDLFKAMNGMSWAGCVEERPMPHDVDDEAPTTGDPATLFVPMFAPDEPDNWTCSTSTCSHSGSGSSRTYAGAPGGNQGFNNYLSDVGVAGNCTSADAAQVNSTNEQAALLRTCKYKGSTATSSLTVGGIPGGPNYYCNSTAITPLSASKSTITTAIDAMQAKGATSILSGISWGLRVLSPTEPFTEGRAYNEPNNTKYMVVMTDGENTYYPNSTFVKSWYGSYGYVWKNHLGTTSTSQSTIEGKMDERTALACKNAKDAGIKVYTLAFNVTDKATLAMLQACASDPKMAYETTGTSELLAAFQAIGDEISLIRIAR